jgi:hypothetical protein
MDAGARWGESIRLPFGSVDRIRLGETLLAPRGAAEQFHDVIGFVDGRSLCQQGFAILSAVAPKHFSTAVAPVVRAVPLL